jgi:hypothetical protein
MTTFDEKARIPEGFTYYPGEEIMSNFDHKVVKETAEAIKGKPLISHYSGWHFNGQVWWENDKWMCEVWRYGHWVKTFICDTLEEIMFEVSCEYGDD